MKDLEYVDMRLGEKKKVSILVSATYGRTFEITNATFSLVCGNDEESTGDCDIEMLNESECIISALVEPLRKNAIYVLDFWYDIYPKQRLNYKCLVRVM